MPPRESRPGGDGTDQDETNMLSVRLTNIIRIILAIIAASVVVSTHPPKEFYIDVTIGVIVATIVAAIAVVLWRSLKLGP